MSKIDLMHNVVIGDARAILKLMTADSIDLVVTSPPYFNLKNARVESIS